MKILFFLRYTRYYNKDEALHADFAKAISEHPDIKLKMYGPYIEDIYPELMITPWSRAVGMEHLLKEFKADVILLCTKSRMFNHYSPFDGQDYSSACWLPSGWESNSVPKVMLEEDYFYEKDDDWYYKNHINMILQRHYSQALRGGSVPKLWFPFSVDTNVYKPSPEIKRTNRICFVGGLGMNAYVHRNMACKKLKEQNLIDIFYKDEKVGKDYIKCLQEYVCHVNGNLIYNTTPAKILEIIASGSVLLNNAGPGMRILLPNQGYCVYNENNVVEIGKKILADEEFRNDIIERGLKDIKEKHTHAIRIQELITILKKQFNI